MHDGRAIVPSPTIPGWRLILSDRSRFWAFRETPFPIVARRAGAEPDLDADTFDEIRALVEHHEEIARQATARVTS
ncbi:hypothetical protein AB0395_47420 [Streptosporangium sp. NPDC051023]|uniref:hypothetical protein n=1 Tax=Streptosporangium sp. NPDC051023 TaxID=3155410 RepID=UPI00344C3A20